MGARLWRLPPRGANTLPKHIRAEEFYVVLDGAGRLRVGDETLAVPRYGGVLVSLGRLSLPEAARKFTPCPQPAS